MNNIRTHRAVDILRHVTLAYPNAWNIAEVLRGKYRQSPGNDWPDWAYLSLQAILGLISSNDPRGSRLPIETERDVFHHEATLGALAAWRMGKQVVRFDNDLYQTLIKTQLPGNLPIELFYYLPAWCIYIETPGLTYHRRPLHGFFVQMVYSSKSRIDQLQFCLDVADSPELALDKERGMEAANMMFGDREQIETMTRDVARIMMVDKGEPEDSLLIKERLDQISASMPNGGEDATYTTITYNRTDLWSYKETMADLTPLISLALYLCSEEPDWGKEPPQNPCPVKTKKGLRVFPVSTTSVWDVGVRIGSALRRAYDACPEDKGGAHASPRPHIRIAHWHTFRTGKGRAGYRAKFLPPIPVNFDERGIDNLPATVRKAE